MLSLSFTRAPDSWRDVIIATKRGSTNETWETSVPSGMKQFTIPERNLCEPSRSNFKLEACSSLDPAEAFLFCNGYQKSAGVREDICRVAGLDIHHRNTLGASRPPRPQTTWESTLLLDSITIILLTSQYYDAEYAVKREDYPPVKSLTTYHEHAGKNGDSPSAELRICRSAPMIPPFQAHATCLRGYMSHEYDVLDFDGSPALGERDIPLQTKPGKCLRCPKYKITLPTFLIHHRYVFNRNDRTLAQNVAHSHCRGMFSVCFVPGASDEDLMAATMNANDSSMSKGKLFRNISIGIKSNGEDVGSYAASMLVGDVLRD
ncbi:uncharacterized protein BT62DRAFT_1012826 [Guyanagaster necrorhizus]|uniref:Uncharacterized protein n=1 Tax=Guyanagaster necrorhizus TaxID=856835 RepID=A0A9P7VHV2_9AGAR|nr:uncharacterized protein BT62DRAFT_1012826 [Guyanagaster necrorhizus MCA 3950]KAG7440321.1 hypothetical protein BT62DRAFT_1012826 [Guyanagaster necrorhizus MCA 3950]